MNQKWPDAVKNTSAALGFLQPRSPLKKGKEREEKGRLA
jgi:hypothetical protein